MKFHCLTMLAVVSLAQSSVLHADTEVATAQGLEALGATVVLEGDRVVELSFRDSKRLGNEQWRAIGSLTHLKKLTAYGGAKGLNDETVGFLVGLQELESLSLDGAQLSDGGLAKLAELKRLKRVSFFHLSFRKEGFTGEGFSAWTELPDLESLTVAGMSMGDDGFRAIATLTNLRQLRTWHTYRTEASNAEIAKLPRLTTLKLGQRLPQRGNAPLSLSDASLETLTQIKTLETLEIGEADFHLPALRQLAKLPRLKQLKIDRTYLSEADIDALKSALPGVQIGFEPLTEDQRKKLDAYLK
ncbi:Leucine Rich repeats (2 copies) [Rosistilla oblonga]|uniref:Leucine Rich repeats (2 copies) n=2 Tax=Rosistilla oblonga TaxID=2527990 RepID=A0A518IRD6_9BACT|nr:Leucine Rich repeats (2 copies) [Rosistilla oblonga]